MGLKEGEKYGKLTVLEFSHRNEKGKKVFKFQCECGNITYAIVNNVKSGKTQSCGLCNSLKVGEVYNLLTVLEFSHKGKAGHYYYKCQCECGNIIITRGTSVKKGISKSCGCTNTPRVGDKFSRLTVVQYSHTNKHGGKVFECLCECGNTTFATSNSLNMGATRSCGCLLRDTNSRLCKERSGDKHPLWKGGASFEPYCILFNNEFRERVREFFGRKCVECGKTEEESGARLSVHHVNFRKDSCCAEDAPRLFVPLCRSCHTKTNYNREYWEERYTTMINEQYDGQCYLPKEEIA